MKRDNVLNWINNEIMRTQVYQSHKENMMWVATALYITGAITLGIRFQLHPLDDCYKLFVFIVAFVITGLMIWFVCWQFENREVASLRFSGLLKTAIGLCKEDYPRLKWYVKKGYLYPNFINENIKGEQKQKNDGWKSLAISIGAMGVAFGVFQVLVLC